MPLGGPNRQRVNRGSRRVLRRAKRLEAGPIRLAVAPMRCLWAQSAHEL